MMFLQQKVLKADPCCGHEHAKHAGLPSYLALVGEQVTLLLRDSETLRQYQAAPLQLESDSGFEYPQLDVSSVEGLATTIDCLLVTTKSFSTLEAIRAVEHRFTTGTKIH